MKAASGRPHYFCAGLQTVPSRLTVSIWLQAVHCSFVTLGHAVSQDRTFGQARPKASSHPAAASTWAQASSVTPVTGKFQSPLGFSVEFHFCTVGLYRSI